MSPWNESTQGLQQAHMHTHTHEPKRMILMGTGYNKPLLCILECVEKRVRGCPLWLMCLLSVYLISVHSSKRICLLMMGVKLDRLVLPALLFLLWSPAFSFAVKAHPPLQPSILGPWLPHFKQSVPILYLIISGNLWRIAVFPLGYLP